jgi:hypothetical protein
MTQRLARREDRHGVEAQSGGPLRDVDVGARLKAVDQVAGDLQHLGQVRRRRLSRESRRHLATEVPLQVPLRKARMHRRAEHLRGTGVGLGLGEQGSLFGEQLVGVHSRQRDPSASDGREVQLKHRSVALKLTRPPTVRILEEAQARANQGQPGC